MKTIGSGLVIAVLLAGCASLHTPRDGFVTLAEAVPDAILEIRLGHHARKRLQADCGGVVALHAQGRAIPRHILQLPRPREITAKETLA